jgi:hypothetical protein
MASLDDLRIPVAMRAVAGAIIVLTDDVCADLLDEKYASLAQKVVAKLARKRRDQPGTWPLPGVARSPASTRASPASPVSGTLTCTTATM